VVFVMLCDCVFVLVKRDSRLKRIEEEDAIIKGFNMT
jgi:hypothetical protein